MLWFCCLFIVIYMLYIKYLNFNDYMYFVLDVSDESCGIVVQNVDDRLIIYILFFGYIMYIVWMFVSVLLFVLFIGLFNIWLFMMLNDFKIGRLYIGIVIV